ncbi:7319_t:CDS:2 [Entrophospora sp. SA101]|nr:7319_t:CDS:2 [Entrophospora sp. SA101]
MWHPLRKLQELSDEFEKKILYDHPSVPCAYCSMLMMRAVVKWIDYNLDETYDIMIAFSDLQLPLQASDLSSDVLPTASVTAVTVISVGEVLISDVVAESLEC